ncbi:hypothetical protein NKI66_31515 [Mesorhizobium sp. M0518]|uniref:hypothetical protein n=1 Tax=Mesorhizobium sp. M0518 TaxID=2956956 RepID=UPI0033359D2A
MGVPHLQNRNIFIAGDDRTFACDLTKSFATAGAKVIRPVDTIEDALDFITSSKLIDGAVLSVNDQGRVTFIAAEHLRRRRIPCIFVLGFKSSPIPDELKDVRYFEKPVDPRCVIGLMAALIAA